MKKYIKEVIIGIFIIIGIVWGLMLAPQHYKKVYYEYKKVVNKHLKELK